MVLEIRDKVFDTLRIKNLLRQGENNVDTVSFVIKRYYNDLDLSTLSYVLYGDSQSNTRASIELEKEVLEDKLTLIWKIQKDFTAVAGTLTLLIKGYNTQKQEVIKFVGRNPIQVKKTDPNGATVVPPESEYDQALEKLYQILEEAKEVSMYPPRIGENDNWEVYNNVLNEYVDTGISVRGAQPKGEWSASATYQKLDIVSYQGSSFAVLKEISGIVPTNDNINYMLIAQKGDVGKSAYEYAKESGFVGTEQEFAQAQSDILNAKNEVESVKEEVSLIQTQVNQSATQVSNDKQAVEAARQDVSLKHTEVLEKAEQVKTSVESFDSSVVQAKEEIETSKTNAVQEINRSGETARQSVIAEGTSQTENVTNTGTQAVANVQSKATEQLNLIASAGTSEVQKVATEGAKQVQAATEQANLAKQSADIAASKVQEVAESVTAGKQEIATAKDSALSAVQGEGGKQVQAVNTAGTAHVQAVNDAGKAQISAVQSEGTKQSKAVADAGAAQVQAVGTEGQKQVAAVQSEGQKQAEKIKAIESLLPAPTAQDAGKVPMVNPEGNGYELGEVNSGGCVDAYTKAESDKRFAPMAVAIKPTASGELVTLNDSAEFGLQGLKIYGKSTQDGEPTPENPIPIVSVGEGGNVDVSITGSNILILPSENYERIGVTVSIKDGVQYVSGTAKDTGDLKVFSVSIGFSGKITIRSKGTVNTRVFLNRTIKANNPNVSISMDVAYGDVLGISIYVESGRRYENEPIYWWAYVEPNASEFTPYQSQSLPIPTPNGLLGIPVKSGGNYTDSKGQQWVCDEIDISQKLLVHNVYFKHYNASDLRYISGKGYNIYTYIEDEAGVINGDIGGLCSVAKYLPSMASDNTFRPVVAGIRARFDSIQSADDIPRVFPDGVDCLFFRKTAQKVPITGSELIEKFNALHTYYPTTNIFASDNAGVEVQYLADTKLYIDSKLQSLVAQYHANRAALLSLMPLETQAEMIQNDTDNILFQEGI